MVEALLLIPLFVVGLSDGLEKAIQLVREGKSIHPFEKHAAVSKAYNWRDVCQRTLKVYEATLSYPKLSFREQQSK